MKRILLRTLVITLMVAMLLVNGQPTYAESADETNPGLDVIILLDISFSMFPGKDGTTPHDPEAMCLDASAMLINMCDAQYSRVAVVPFTNQIPETSNWWNRWVDVSDANYRRALCDELYCKNMMDLPERGWHNGVTDHRVPLKAAKELIENREPDQKNPVLVVMIGDSDVEEKALREDITGECVNLADEIKAMGAKIYCLDLGADSSKTLMRQIASGTTNEEKMEFYWSGLRADDLKVYFGRVFADMIGSKQDQRFATVNENGIELDLYVPNNSVSEVNFVLKLSQIDGLDSIVLKHGDDVVTQGPNLLMYTQTNPVVTSTGYSPAARTYDFVSVKLIDPDAGSWTLSAKRGNIDTNEQMSIDVLFNYDVQLKADVDAQGHEGSYYQKDTVKLTANFVDAQGEDSQDEFMYRGDSDADHPGIKAFLTVYDSDGNAVLSDLPMQANQEQLRFEYDLPVGNLGQILIGGPQSYFFEVKAYGEVDSISRTSLNKGTFQVENTTPSISGSATETMDPLTVENILQDSSIEKTATRDLNTYFLDADGDELTYKIQDADGVSADIEGNTLYISGAGEDNVENAWVEVVAVDSMGQESEPMRFETQVISVKALVDECVSARLVPEDEQAKQGEIHKGETLNVELKFEIKAPEGKATEFPYNHLQEIVTEEALKNAARVDYRIAQEPTDMNWEKEDDYNGVLNVGVTNGDAVEIVAEISLGGVKKEASTGLLTVKNAAPQVKDISQAWTDAGAELQEDTYYITVDREKVDPEQLTFQMQDWFKDDDADQNFDSLEYRVEMLPQEETRDMFTLPRKILRLFGLTEKKGIAVSFDGAEDDPETGTREGTLEGAELTLLPQQFGNVLVKVIATDNDGAEATQVFGCRVISTREKMFCVGVYAVLALILLAILILLYVKLVVHRPWPNRRQPGFQVILNGFQQMTMQGEMQSPFNRTGRAPCKLGVLAKQFEIQDGGAGNAVFNRVQLWPTTGSKIVVEPVNKRVDVKGFRVEGNSLDKKRKCKWPRNGSITVTYLDESGNENVCVFKRY